MKYPVTTPAERWAVLRKLSGDKDADATFEAFEKLFGLNDTELEGRDKLGKYRKVYAQPLTCENLPFGKPSESEVNPKVDPCDIKTCDKCQARITLAVKLLLCTGCVRKFIPRK